MFCMKCVKLKNSYASLCIPRIQNLSAFFIKLAVPLTKHLVPQNLEKEKRENETREQKH